MFLYQEKGIPVPFLTARRKEVIDIIEMLFSQGEVWEMTKKEIAREAKQEGMHIYGEQLKLLVTLGWINDLLAATSDSKKMDDLIRKFGLKI